MFREKRERERERETEAETQTHTDTETDRERDRQTDRQAQIHREKLTGDTHLVCSKAWSQVRLVISQPQFHHGVRALGMVKLKALDCCTWN